MRNPLRGRVAVVTGAGSGIGRATALALASRGVRVHAVDIDPARAASTAAQIASLGAWAAAHEVDVADDDSVRRLADSLAASGEEIDILVNNAGVCAAGPLETLTTATWKRLFEVNVFGATRAIDAFVPPMLARGRGHVVNVASLAGLVPFPFVAPYTASKHALVGLSAAMGMELAHRGVFVTAVCPGAVDTALYTDNPMSLPGRAREKIIDLIRRRAIAPETIAEDIVRAIASRRSLVVRAGPARPLWTFSRLFPRLFLWAARWAFGRLLRRADSR